MSLNSYIRQFILPGALFILLTPRVLFSVSGSPTIRFDNARANELLLHTFIFLAVLNIGQKLHASLMKMPKLKTKEK